MASKLPSGRWRGRVVDHRTGKQTAPHKIIGGPATYPTERQAERAEDEARDMLLGIAERGATVREFWDEWTTSPLWARPRRGRPTSTGWSAPARSSTSTAIDPCARFQSTVVAEWLKGGVNVGTVDVLRAMFNDARRPQAGMLVEANPFAGLGLHRSRRGRKELQPPDQAATAQMIAVADELCPPSFAAYLLTAVWSAARPGELDALQWADIDFRAETIRIERQWNVKVKKFTEPKHGSRRIIAMTDPVAERLQALPRESEFVFTTLRGHHYTPSTRNHHWNRVRAACGIGKVSMYLATRHFYGWYALNVAELPPHVIALQLGHTDGGRLVRELYGHPDAALATEADA